MYHVFVYGTLTSDGGQAGLLGDVARRPATTPGTLWTLPAGYPALAVGPDPVHGELIELPHEHLLQVLDRYEGVDEGLYQRVEVRVRVGSERVTAWAYRMDAPWRRGGKRLRSGRWTPLRRR